MDMSPKLDNVVFAIVAIYVMQYLSVLGRPRLGDGPDWLCFFFDSGVAQNLQLVRQPRHVTRAQAIRPSTCGTGPSPFWWPTACAQGQMGHNQRARDNLIFSLKYLSVKCFALASHQVDIEKKRVNDKLRRSVKTTLPTKSFLKIIN